MIRAEIFDRKLSLLLFLFSCFFLLLGKGIGHLFFDSPYHSLFWDQRILGGFVESMTSMDWTSYVENLSITGAISAGTQVLGGFYVVMALALLTGKRGAFITGMLGISSAFLFLLAFLKYKEHGFQIGQLIELTIGWASPLLLLACWNGQGYNSFFVFFCRLCISLTFVGHGLYAIGFYPVPGHFIDMTIALLGVSEYWALLALRGFGILDFLVAVLIFFLTSGTMTTGATHFCTTCPSVVVVWSG